MDVRPEHANPNERFRPGAVERFLDRYPQLNLLLVLAVILVLLYAGHHKEAAGLAAAPPIN